VNALARGLEEVAMSDAIRSVLAARACSESEIPGGIPAPRSRRLTGAVPEGTAPFVVYDPEVA
jgi:hypothetical protein